MIETVGSAVSSNLGPILVLIRLRSPPYFCEKFQWNQARSYWQEEQWPKWVYTIIPATLLPELSLSLKPVLLRPPPSVTGGKGTETVQSTPLHGQRGHSYSANRDAKGEKILLFLHCFLGHTPSRLLYPRSTGSFQWRNQLSRPASPPPPPGGQTHRNPLKY